MTRPESLIALNRDKKQALRETYAVRVAVLDQCQLACGYCMPGNVAPFTPRKAWLNAHHHERLALHFAQRGVQKVRFTGGEPLLRQDLPDVVAAWRRGLPSAELALTTNALLLEDNVTALQDAGLSRINVHLDSLRPDMCNELMGGGDPEVVKAGIAAALKVGMPVKVNAVIQRGKNDDELDAFIQMGSDLGVTVRFIEQMDTGSAPAHVQATFISGADILRSISVPFESVARALPSDPAELFRTETGTMFGLIASDTRPFCDACDRIRIGATGRLRGCLYENGGLDLRPLLDGDDDDALAAAIDAGLLAKKSWHPTIKRDRVPFSMSQIGG